MPYSDNTPNFNVNPRVRNFTDFCANLDGEVEKIKKTKRSFNPNSDSQNFTTNTRNEFDPITRKITAKTAAELDDLLDNIEPNK